MATHALKGQRSLEERARKVTTHVLGQLAEARQAKRLSQDELDQQLGFATGTIAALEAGSGSVATLVVAMEALDFYLVGIGRGDALGEQLAARLDRGKSSRDRVAAQTGLSVTTIERLTQEDGTLPDLFLLLAVLAPQARGQAPERVYWGRARKADRDSRFTSAEFMALIYQAFGPVDLDPCAHPASPVEAARRIILAEGGDGLRDPWSGRLAFVNPPFSAHIDWLMRAYEEWSAGRVETVVCLIPVRTDNRFFHETLRHIADIFLLRGRLRFASIRGDVQPTPFALCVAAFGATAEQKARFAALARGCWVQAGATPAVVERRGGGWGHARRHARRLGLRGPARLRFVRRHGRQGKR